MSMTIIYGLPGVGKTLLMSHILNDCLYDFDRISCMQEELKTLNKNGFNYSIPEHCVATGGYDVFGYKYRYRERRSRRINPYYLGFDDGSDTYRHFSLPYEVYGITEAQKYFNSRMSVFYPDWQSRFFEGHRHNHLEFFFDCQRADLIDLNIRSLCAFWEVLDSKVKLDKFGCCKHVEWFVRQFEDIKAYDAYMLTGGKDNFFYKDVIIKADYDVFRLYDSFCLKPKFFQKYFEKDADLLYGEPREDSLEYYVDYLKKYNDELPDWFYKKRYK